jgi:S-adenosylhomocysteine hydrolase
MEKRRRGLINAAARRYYVLLDPELLDVLVSTKRNPMVVIGEGIHRMRPDEIVLNLGHFKVD